MQLTPEPLCLDGGINFHVPAADGDLRALWHVEAVLHLLPGNDLALLRHEAPCMLQARHTYALDAEGLYKHCKLATIKASYGGSDCTAGMHLIIQCAAARLDLQHAICKGLVLALLRSNHTALLCCSEENRKKEALLCCTDQASHN